MSPSDHEVLVDWNPNRNSGFWNEICADIIEVFGLPGDRFVSSPTEDFMIFTFKNKKDAALCRILISEKI
jgi:hypothetical protein